jgi:CCR4-NOT transcription complex subunit 4
MLVGGSSSSSNITNTLVEDELGFDPFAETQKALAEMIETEQQQHQRLHSYHQQQLQQQQQQQHQQCQLNQMNQTPPQLIQQHFPPQHLQVQ